MLQWFFDLFKPKSSAPSPRPPPKPPKAPRPGNLSISADQSVVSGGSSFVYTKNGKVVYEERNGKVITGTPADKAEGEKVAADISASTNQMIDNMQRDMDRMFNDMKRAFGPGFPFNKP